VADDEVVDEEIEDPVEDEVTSAARSITEELLRHNVTERSIEKINDFRYYLREFIHSGCKGTAFLRDTQEKNKIFKNIAKIEVKNLDN
jgi:hypothetical protein